MTNVDPANAVERVAAALDSKFEDAQARALALCAARANEFKGMTRARNVERGRLGISILDTRVVGPQIEIFARVFRDGEQLGFGLDGSVDVERFVIVNPPLTVRDPGGEIVRLKKSVLRVEGEQRLRIDLQECLISTLHDMILHAGKTGTKIQAGKQGQTTYTIFSNGNDDGYVDSSNATYTTARAGSSLGVQTGGASFMELGVGQSNNGGSIFTVQEGFANFTTSTVAGTVSSAVLSLYGSFDSSATDFTINARRHDYTASGLTTADWIAGASLSGQALLATFATSSGWSNSGYNVFTSNANFITNINQAGVTGIILASSRHEAGNQPTTDEAIGAYNGAQSGTTNDPRLVIEASTAFTRPFTGPFRGPFRDPFG